MFVNVTNTETLLYTPHTFLQDGTLWNSKINLWLAPVTTLRQHSTAPLTVQSVPLPCADFPNRQLLPQRSALPLYSPQHMYVVGATCDRSFARGAEHLRGHQLHNKGVEIAVREWMRRDGPISAATELSPWHKVKQMHHADKQRYFGAMITALNLGTTSGVIGTTLKDAAYCTSTQTTKQAYNLVMEHVD